jgi:hypothetical protein
MDPRESTEYSQLWNNMETSGSERSSVDLTNNHIIDSGYFNHTNLSSEDSSKMNQGISNITITCPENSNNNQTTTHVFSGIAALLSRSNSNSNVINIPSKTLIFVSGDGQVDAESKSSSNEPPATSSSYALPTSSYSSSSSSASSSTKCLSSNGLRLSANNLFGTSDSQNFGDGFHVSSL